MRLGGLAAAAGALPLLGACALPAEPRMACADHVILHFPEGKAELNLDAVGKVLLTVSTLEACPAAQATVTGHADIGEVRSLADARAANVAAVMAKNGVDRGRIALAEAPPLGAPRTKPDNRFVSISWK